MVKCGVPEIFCHELLFSSFPHIGSIFAARVVAVSKGERSLFVELNEKLFGYVNWRQSAPLPSKGSLIYVQVVKLPYLEPQKHLKVTTYISFATPHLIYYPSGSGLTYSHRGEAYRLREANWIKDAQALVQVGGGVKLRTSLIFQENPLDVIEKDIRYVRQLWSYIQAQAPTKPQCLYKAPSDIARFLFQWGEEAGMVTFDDPKTMSQVKEETHPLTPSLSERMRFQSSKIPGRFSEEIEGVWDDLLSPNISNSQGIMLSFEGTKIGTFIDVNRGSYQFVASRHTAHLDVNLAAIPFIARQIKLRQLEGVLFIDFINCYEDKWRHTVKKALMDALNLYHLSITGVQWLPSGILTFIIEAGRCIGFPLYAHLRSQVSLEERSLFCQFIRHIHGSLIKITQRNVIVFISRELSEASRDVPEVLDTLQCAYGVSLLLREDPNLTGEEFILSSE